MKGASAALDTAKIKMMRGISCCAFFFLVFSQLTVGGLALMHLVPASEIGPGFFGLCF